ncbi:MAG: carbamoyltransferase [Myxococcota bacterium]|jgi:carbamoyltransferase
MSLHEDSNANATLFKDGRPIYAVAEARLNRVKYSGGFPELAMKAALDYANISLSDVDVILPANRTHFLPRMYRGLLPAGEHDYFGPRHKAWLYFQQALSRGGALSWLTGSLSRSMLKRRFPKLADFVDHHTAHAYSAWLTSGFDEATAVTSDNMGDGYSSRVFDCSGKEARYLYGSSARHSPGQFYGEIAQLLGFHNLNAGKVTGLAAHGNPARAYPVMEKLFALNAEKTGFVTPELLRRGKTRGLHGLLSSFSKEEIAAAAQKRLEDVMVDYVRTAVRNSGKPDVVLAGGTFANVVVNQRILLLPEVRRVFIHPAMTDQGISMGAGLAYLRESVTNEPLPTVFLGPDIFEEEAGQELERSGLRYERPDDMADVAAKALIDRRVVARCCGRVEYGPRALGNRSIMYRTDDPAVNTWLNSRLNRTEFMPFAPVTLDSHMDECYKDTAGGELATRYMTITFEVREAMKRQSPGVVHLDGTARPQIIREQDNPGYHAILQRFYELTGTPTLVNTSFNMHGEPIVGSPYDAIRAFKASRLDHLILGPFWVHRADEG